MLQKIPLRAGWSLISLFVQPDATTWTEVLTHALNNSMDGDQVKTRSHVIDFVDITYQGDTFRQWFADPPITWDVDTAYYINVRQQQEFSVNGDPIALDRNFTIPQYWQYLPYHRTTREPLQDAIPSFDFAEKDLIKNGYQWSVYSEQYGWIGSLTHMVPGEGYHMWTSKAGVGRYAPLPSAVSSRRRLDSSDNDAHACPWTVEGRASRVNTQQLLLTVQNEGGAGADVADGFVAAQSVSTGEIIDCQAISPIVNRFFMLPAFSTSGEHMRFLFTRGTAAENVTLRIFDQRVGANGDTSYYADRINAQIGTLRDPVRLMLPLIPPSPTVSPPPPMPRLPPHSSSVIGSVVPIVAATVSGVALVTLLRCTIVKV